MVVSEFYAKIDGDYEGIKGRLRSDAIIEKFLIKFLEEKSYDELMAAAKDNNVQEAISAAHKMKGVTANLSLTPLYNVLTELLAKLREENQTVVDEVLLQKATEEYQKIIKVLQEN